jgi:hypothetical protein
MYDKKLLPPMCFFLLREVTFMSQEVTLEGSPFKSKWRDRSV